MNLIGIDFETASQCNLKTHGAWRYSLHPSTVVRCAVFGLVNADGSVRTIKWEPGDSIRRVSETWVHLAHNCAFERAIWTNVLTPRYGWPPCPEMWEDTQAHAAAANLPVTLEGLGAALGCPIQKDTEGHDLMIQMSKLDAQGKNEHDTLENRQRLLEYCETDVRSMLSIWQRVPKMIPSERQLWELDQRINARGVYLDRALVARMRDMADLRRSHLHVGMFDVTDWEIITATDTAKVKKFVKDRGVELPTVKRTRVTGEEHESESIGRSFAAEIAADETTDPAVRAVLQNRMEIGKLTSLAKLKKVELLVDPRDGRLRNSLQFCAAHTGRWSSRGLQLHNLARPRKGDTPEEKAVLAKAYKAVIDGDYQALAEACR